MTRLVATTLLTILTTCGALTHAAEPEELPAMPEIGIIDFFGPRTLTIEQSRALLPIQAGASYDEFIAFYTQLELDKTELTRTLGNEPVGINVVCCAEDGRSVLYLGLKRSDADEQRYLPTPTGDIRLPETIVSDYETAMKHLLEAVKTRQGIEDRSQGHSLFSYPPVLNVQQRYLAYAKQHRQLLEQTVADSADAQHRAIAATVLAYAEDKENITGYLTDALRDPDSAVRNDAARALLIMTVYAAEHPELGIEFSSGSFINMLTSGGWTDLNKASWMLVSMTRTRDPVLLQELQEEALPALIDICRWELTGHAESGCRILERILGRPEQEVLHPKAATIARAVELLPEGSPYRLP